ncbi:hypothetical protein Tco_0877646 [Tanacetum coccineum]|uniref:Uncharacterized protein n=1 Tax=Tanacetum coccineum TaxID=301880 RepID=A0ABQ5BVN0_9ASTR
MNIQDTKIQEQLREMKIMIHEIQQIKLINMLKDCQPKIDQDTYTPEPLTQRSNVIYYGDDDDEESTSQLPLSIAITTSLPVLPTSSVEDLVPIPSESKDTSDNDNECDLPFCDDSPPLDVLGDNSVTFSNLLSDSNDDFTFSNDESLLEEDIQEENFKIYSNHLFEFDEEYIYSDINPLYNEVLEDIENKDSYVSNLDEPALLVTPLSNANEDECAHHTTVKPPNLKSSPLSRTTMQSFLFGEDEHIVVRGIKGQEYLASVILMIIVADSFYDDWQGYWNAGKARDCTMLKTLEIDIKGYSTHSSSQSPSHSAFVSTTSTSKKMSYAESPSFSSSTTYSAPSSSKARSHSSGNVLQDVLHSLVAESEPEQQVAYEDFEQIDKLDLEEMDIKWQMAMLSVKVNKFEKKAGRKIEFDKKEAARINVEAEIAKKDLQTKLDNHLAKTKKWTSSSKNLFRLIDSSMSVRTKVGLRFDKYIGESELGWDDSEFSIFTLSSDRSGSVKSLEPMTADSSSNASTSSVSTHASEANLESSEGTTIQEPIIVQELPSFSCTDKDVKTSRTPCNKNGYFDKKKAVILGKILILLLQSLCCMWLVIFISLRIVIIMRPQYANDFDGVGYPQREPIWDNATRVTQSNQFVPQAVLLRSGKVSIPAARPNQVPVGRPKPVSTGRPKPVFTCSKNRLLRHCCSYFQTSTPFGPHVYYNQMHYDGDGWAAAVKPSAGYSWKSHRNKVYSGTPRDYYNSEGEIIYLKSLLNNDTIPYLPPEVFLDHDPRSLKDEPNIDDLKIKENARIAPDYEDSRARVEKKYPLRKKVLLQMLELKLESEEDSTMALELIRFVKKLLAELEPEDSDGDEEDL